MEVLYKSGIHLSIGRVEALEDVGQEPVDIVFAFPYVFLAESGGVLWRRGGGGHLVCELRRTHRRLQVKEK